MKYEKGTFVVVPNKNHLKGKPAEMQSVYLWLIDHSNDEGQCFPSRKKLSKEAGCGIATVDKYLAKLVEDGFVKITPRFNHDTHSRNSNMYTLLLIEGLSENDTPPHIKTDIVTVPILNSTHLTQVEAPAEIKKIQLPDSLGKTYIARLLYVYNRLFRDKYGFAATLDMGRFGKSMKSLVQTKNEVQIAAMMIIFFNWRGMNGGDEFVHKKLIDNTFSPQWFASTINQYEAYLRNVFNLNLDNEVETMEFVRENLSKLIK